MNWEDNKPIYQQVKDKIINMILDGSITAGKALPSARKVSAQWQINPRTVLIAYNELLSDQIIIKQLGQEFIVSNQAKDLVLQLERDKFLNQEWPKIQEKVKKLGLNHLIKE